MRRRRGTIAARTAAGLVSLLVLVSTGLLWSVTQKITSSVRIATVDLAHTSSSALLPMTVLLIGSDLRVGADVGGGVSGQRADALLVARFQPDHTVDVLSVPRDAWVPIPGRGTAKINAALNGSPSLVVRTVERLTGLGIDHVVVVDFDGLRDLTTALGGVTVDNPAASTDPLTHQHFPAGRLTLSGDRALTFVRQRYGLPGGDFGRIVRQQDMLAAIGRRLAADPGSLPATARIVARDVTVDRGLTPPVVTTLALAVMDSDIRFYTAPSAGFGTAPDGESYVRLNIRLLTTACRALRDDRPVPLPATPIRVP